MRILQLTPGTGHFYCGNCLRDHALSAALRRLGHEASIVPLYLPFQLEESPLPRRERVHMGGINLYLQHKHPWMRRLPGFLRRWMDAPRLLRWSSRMGDMTDAASHADMTLSMLRGSDGRQQWELARLIDWLKKSGERPDVIILCNALLIGLARPLREAMGCRVICTLQGEDAFLDALPVAASRQAWSLVRERAAGVDAFIAVSGYYADVMRGRLGLRERQVHVVYNGIDFDGFPTSLPSWPRNPEAPVIGFLARMCEEKGLITLVEAFIQLRQRGRVPHAKLRVAGVMLKPDRRLVSQMQTRLDEAGFAADSSFHPNLSREQKLVHLASLDLFSAPATYGEAFGLYVIEAMAAGAPVVQPRHGAFPELIEATGGGTLCEPNDPGSLADALERLLLDHDAARRLAAQGFHAARERFTSERMARDVAEVCKMAPSPAAAADLSPHAGVASPVSAGTH